MIMLTKTKITIALLSLSILSACSTHNPNGYVNYQGYWYEGSEIYPEGYDNNTNYADYPQQKPQVVVPETYHVGSSHNPTSFKSIDKSWASQQNPNTYTIELANGEKASGVANTLQKAPKSERRAQIKYQQGGKTYYKGVYGTYPSKEAAQKALQSLPEDVRGSASVESWGSVQSTTGN